MAARGQLIFEEARAADAGLGFSVVLVGNGEARFLIAMWTDLRPVLALIVRAGLFVNKGRWRSV